MERLFDFLIPILLLVASVRLLSQHREAFRDDRTKNTYLLLVVSVLMLNAGSFLVRILDDRFFTFMIILMIAGIVLSLVAGRRLHAEGERRSGGRR